MAIRVKMIYGTPMKLYYRMHVKRMFVKGYEYHYLAIKYPGNRVVLYPQSQYSSVEEAYAAARKCSHELLLGKISLMVNGISHSSIVRAIDKCVVNGYCESGDITVDAVVQYMMRRVN